MGKNIFEIIFRTSQAMKKNDLDVSFCEIEADWGHDAFLLPNDRLSGMISGFLDRVQHEG